MRSLASKPLAVVGVAMGLLCAPVLVDVASSPRERPFGYVAADAFYYLGVARNIVRHGMPSYDGRFAMNGFHPLWQAVVALVYGLSEALGLGRHAVLLLVLVSLAFVAGAVLLLGSLLRDAEGRLTPAFVALPVGVYGLLVAPFYAVRLPELSTLNRWEGSMPVYGTLWSFVNGMESGAVLFFYALSGVLFVRATNTETRLAPARAAAALGTALSLLTLSRLDHGVIAIAVLVAFVTTMTPDTEHRRRALVAAFAFGAPLAPYLLYNLVFFGHPIPVSGLSKSTFPHPTRGNLDAIATLFHQSLARQELILFYREAALVIPSFVAFAFIAFGAVRAHRARATSSGAAVAPVDRFLGATAIGVLVLGAYDGLFVRPLAQGHWYLPVSIVFVSLVPLRLLAGTLCAPRVTALALATATCVVASLGFFLLLHRHRDYHAAYATFYWEQAPRIRRYYADSSPGFLEFDDGIVAFSLDLPTMSSDLALDPEAARARREGRLFRLALERGFDRVVSLVYQPPVVLPRDASGVHARRWAERLMPGEDLRGLTFTVENPDPESGLPVIRGRRP